MTSSDIPASRRRYLCHDMFHQRKRSCQLTREHTVCMSPEEGVSAGCSCRLAAGLAHCLFIALHGGMLSYNAGNSAVSARVAQLVHVQG